VIVRKRSVIVALVAVGVLAIYGVHVISRMLRELPIPLPVGDPCTVGTESTTVRLAAEQVASAATIAAVGIRRGVPRRAIVVALATAWQESKLQNLTGGDRDSIGLFQQRPSQGWGTAEKIADPRYSAGRFYTALLKVKGWQQMRVTDAAQRVQRSAYPEAYEKWADESEVLAGALVGELVGAVNCTVSGDPPQRGTVAVQQLSDGLRLDWGEVRSAQQPAAISVTARDAKAGWQYAHWLVAHATDRGVRRVRFADQEWRADTGTWGRFSADPATPAGNTVLAEVHA